MNIRVVGQVQGVGFRPFVWNRAVGLSLTGSVRNDSEGVVIEVQGERTLIDTFLAEFVEQAPSLAVIEEQNQQLLRPVDRRASMQNRLQLTIEWFSAVAITVYVLQLARIVLDGAAQFAPRLNVALVVAGLAAPVAAGVLLLIGRVRRRYIE